MEILRRGQSPTWQQLIRDTIVAPAGFSLVALAVVYGVWCVLRSLDAELVEAQEILRDDARLVPMARRPIEVGAVIAEADLEVVAMPVHVVPLDAVLDPARIVGRTAVERLLPGEPVRLERLARREAGQGLSAIVPSGLRAISLDLDDGGISGFALAGDHVDLLVTLRDPRDPDRPGETVTVVQGARVLAVGVGQDERDGRARGFLREHVTLAVAPDAVERVTRAVQAGRPRLTLRSAIDPWEVVTDGAFTADLLGTTRPRSGRIALGEPTTR